VQGSLTEGSIRVGLFKFSLPILFANILQISQRLGELDLGRRRLAPRAHAERRDALVACNNHI
jgi:hypothetical protein